MEGELCELIGRCVQHEPFRGGDHVRFCARHEIDLDRFCYHFAKVVALAFVRGEMSYTDGDLAMSLLDASMDIDLRGFPLDVYLAFDQGEYAHDQGAKGIIRWQTYTLPAVMEALAREALLPRD